MSTLFLNFQAISLPLVIKERNKIKKNKSEQVTISVSAYIQLWPCRACHRIGIGRCLLCRLWTRGRETWGGVGHHKANRTRNTSGMRFTLDRCTQKRFPSPFKLFIYLFPFFFFLSDLIIIFFIIIYYYLDIFLCLFQSYTFSRIPYYSRLLARLVGLCPAERIQMTTGRRVVFHQEIFVHWKNKKKTSGRQMHNSISG